MRSLFTIFTVLLGFWSIAPLAQSSNAIPNLKAKNFAVVEKEFSELQQRFERGAASEYELLDAYKAFYLREDAYRAELDGWIKSYPNSSSAYLARGVYFRKLGEFRRGGAYISKVPQENLSYMEKMYALAKQDLSQSLKLNPRSYLAVLHLLNIAQFQGDDVAAARYLSVGNEIFPTNFIVRARYLIHLTPRWGGSYREMEEFVNKCRAEGVPQDKINMFLAIISEDKGDIAKQQGKIPLAQAEYKKALVYSQKAGSRFRQDYLIKSLSLCQSQEHRTREYCL